MRLPEWLVEQGVGETRAVKIENGEIIEARIELEGAVPAGTIVPARLMSVGRNALAKSEDGLEYLLPKGALASTEGSSITIEVTREAIPGDEPWKRPLGKLSDKPAAAAAPIAVRLGGRSLSFPAPADELGSLGWNELIEEARSGIVGFEGGELRIYATPAMTLIDVDGYLPPEELAVRGAREAACAILRLDIGGSIGIDLPTAGGKSARQAASAAIDQILPQPFERTAVNGFGFVQVIRPRLRPSLVELAQDRAAFAARALLRRVAFEPPGSKRIVAHPAVIKVLGDRKNWIALLAQQAGGAIELRAEPKLPMSGGYAETV